MVTHTISVTEIIWTLFCSVGLIFNFLILIRAIGDLVQVRISGMNDLREYSANLTVFVYVMLSFVQLNFVVAGIIFMTIPPINGRPVNAIQIVITSIFILVSAVLGLGALINERARQKLIKRIRAKEKLDGS